MKTRFHWKTSRVTKNRFPGLFPKNWESRHIYSWFWLTRFLRFQRELGSTTSPSTSYSQFSNVSYLQSWLSLQRSFLTWSTKKPKLLGTFHLIIIFYNLSCCRVRQTASWSGVPVAQRQKVSSYYGRLPNGRPYSDFVRGISAEKLDS